MVDVTGTEFASNGIWQ